MNEGVVGLIDNVDKGRMRDEADAKLREIVAAMQETGKGGKLSIEFSIQPNKSTGVVEVSYDVKAKIPQPRKFASIFFATPDNNLSRMDIRQRDMFDHEAA